MKIYLLILLLAGALRFVALGEIPAGLHADAASQGYNAYSLKQTGQDRYGENFPILFRAYGTYQPPLYTYLTVIPVSFFGNSAFSARFISALSGVILIAISLYLFRKNPKIVLFIGLTLGLAPWSIFFNRLTVEASLGLTLFIGAVALFIKSLKANPLLPLACFILGLSTHAYYSERVLAALFLPLFLILFRKSFTKKFILLGMSAFLITAIPHLFVIQSGAFAKRFDQVSYLNDLTLFGKLEAFISVYLSYLSPKNLFFDSGSNLGRIIPGLGVFYSWFLVPFLVGLRGLFFNKNPWGRILLVIFLIAPLPASLTGDVFYPLRTQVLLWSISIIIAIGLFTILEKFPRLKILALALLLHSVFSLYISYFVLFKHEKSSDYGYPYIKLMEILPQYQDKEITIDSGRDPGIGIRMAYLGKTDPRIVQSQLKPQMGGPYYSGSVNSKETLKIGNIAVKPIDWSEDCNMEALLIGDNVAIADAEVALHGLKLEFEIKDLSGNITLRGFTPLPKDKCLK